MIQIHVNPAKVDKVVFIPASRLEEELDFAAWQAIQPLVDKMNRRLRRIVLTIQKGPSIEGQREARNRG